MNTTGIKRKNMDKKKIKVQQLEFNLDKNIKIIQRNINLNPYVILNDILSNSALYTFSFKKPEPKVSYVFRKTTSGIRLYREPFDWNEYAVSKIKDINEIEKMFLAKDLYFILFTKNKVYFYKKNHKHAFVDKKDSKLEKDLLLPLYKKEGIKFLFTNKEFKKFFILTENNNLYLLNNGILKKLVSGVKWIFSNSLRKFYFKKLNDNKIYEISSENPSKYHETNEIILYSWNNQDILFSYNLKTKQIQLSSTSELHSLLINMISLQEINDIALKLKLHCE